VIAGRRQDVLVFDLQTQAAESFGYRPTQAKRASEQLMRRYYWAAKAVTQLATILIQNIEAQLFPATSGITRVLSHDRFVEKQGMLEIVDDGVFERHPDAILEAFLLYETTRGVKGLSARTLRALYNSREIMNDTWRRDAQNRHTFMQILQQPEGITHAFRLMNQTSVLGRYLLNFRRIVGQMQHDLYHVYTVDQHILMVLRNIRRFAVAEHAHEYPFCSQLIGNFERPWVLYVAALFHDIAKGRGGDHSTLGMADARRFCREHGIGGDDAALIVWLVQHHLTMSQVAQKQDTSDPEVIKRFAAIVGNERYLTALYLLTVADIRGTSPKVWNTWKGKLLEDLYRITLAVLGGAKPDAHSELKSRQEQALALLRLETVPDDAHRALWDQLDVGFFLRHDAADIAWQTRVLYRHVNAETAIVRARPSPIGDALQVLVYVKDRPTCSRASARTSTATGCRCSMPASARRGTATRSTTSSSRRPSATCATATSRISSNSSSRRGSPKPRRCRSRRRAACRDCPALFRSRRASTCGPTSAASTTSCPCPRTTGRAFSIRSRACWPSIGSASMRRGSIRSANASRTSSCSMVPACPTTACRSSSKPNCCARSQSE
jgi:[protein-PII] uridylyltransferase